MSSSYLDDKVREALAAAQGGRAMAQKTLMLWAWQDERLLKEMAKPFLKAIAAAALEGAVRRGVRVPGMTAGGRPAPQALPPSALNQVLNLMGGGAGPEQGTAEVRSVAAALGHGRGPGMPAGPAPGAVPATAAPPPRRGVGESGAGEGSGAPRPALQTFDDSPASPRQGAALRTIAAAFAKRRP